MSGSKKPLSKSPRSVEAAEAAAASVKTSEEPKLCIKNCGFFGHANFGGQCSRCYQADEHKSSSTGKPSSDSLEAAPLLPGTPGRVSWAETPPEKSSSSSSSRTPFPRPPTPYSALKTTPEPSDRGHQKIKRSFSKQSFSSSSSSTSSSGSQSTLFQGSCSISSGKRQKMAKQDQEKEEMPSVRSAEVDGMKKKPLTKQQQLQRKAKKSRCEKCGTSIEVIGFDCRCGHRFCVVHRHSAGHGCTFDYRTAGQSELRKANPKVVADKIPKI